jgi:hypothetical protein
MGCGLQASLRARLVSVGLMYALALGGVQDGRAAPGLAIEVDARQRVTMSGSSDSLRSAIAELCERAGVALVAYEAEDRPFTAAYQDVPLSEALARLLRSEIFLVGVRPSHDGSGQVVSWLRVSGASGGIGGGPLRAGTPGPPATTTIGGIDIGVSPEVVQTALTSDDTIARNTARRTILENLRSDPAALQRLLESDPVSVVDQLAGARHAAELLNSLQSVASGVKERTQIQTLLRSLRLRQEAARREAAAAPP